MMSMVSADADLNGLLTLMELARQRGDTQASIETKTVPMVQRKLASIAATLTNLSMQTIAIEEGEV
jgi:hypothetical protein